jgi:hypothetical protein
MRKKLVSSLLVMIMALIVMLPLSAFAADTGNGNTVPVALTASDGKAAQKMFDGLSGSGIEEGSRKVTVELKAKTPESVGTTLFEVTEDNKIIFNQTTFENATDKSKREAMKTFVKAMQDSEMSDQGQKNVIDTFAASDNKVSTMLIPLVMDSTSADVYTAMKWIAPFLPVLRVILGIGAIVIFLLLFVSSVVDLCFIGIPFMRERISEKGEGRSSGRAPFLSIEAQSVVKEAESSLDSSGGYKNVYLMYFKRRAWTYIVLSFCVLYLVVGELGGLIAFLLNLGSGTL